MGIAALTTAPADVSVPVVRAALYLRQSYDRSKKMIKVEQQRKTARKIIAERGWSEVDVYPDNDRSAKEGGTRPEFGRLVADVAAGRVDVIVAWDGNRLMRNQVDRAALVKACVATGTTITTTQGGDIDLSGSDGRAMLGFTTFLGELELDKKSERQREANMDRRENGVQNTARATPFGYRREKVIKDNKDVVVTLHLIPEAGKAIKSAADALLSSSSLRSVCRDWERRGLKPPAADRWWPTTVARVLSNPFYAGINVHNGREYVGDWEHPLDVDTWHRVKELLGRKDRKTARGVTTQGGGIYRCPCRAPMYGARLNGKDGYRCRIGGKGHVQRGDRDQVDHLVAELVISRLSMPDAVDLLKTDDSGAIEELRTRARALRARVDELGHDLADPDIPTAITKDAIRATRKKLTEVEQELADSATTSPLAALVGADDVRSRWFALDIDSQRQIIRALVEVTLHRTGRGRAAMVFNPETVEIEFCR